MTLTKSNLRMLDSGFITPLDYGAAGDNSTDDTTAIQSALDSTYGVIDLAGKTYRITSELTLTRGGVVIRNGTLRYDGAENTLVNLLHIYGTEGSEDNNTLTVNTTIGSSTLTVGTSNIGDYTAGEWIQITGVADVSSNSGGFLHGELHQIYSKDSTAGTLELLTAVSGNLKTSDTTKAQQITTMLENITIENMTFQGSGETTTELGSTPLATDGSTATVTVTQTAHGLSTGDSVYISQADATGGITVADITGSFTVTVTDANTYTYTAGGTSSSATSGGGSSVVTTYGLNRGIYANIVSNVHVKNCTFKDLTYSVVFEKVYSGSIDNNTYYGPGYPEEATLKLLSFCSRISIRDNKLLYPGTAIKVGDTAGSTTQVNIHDNLVDNIGYIGVDISPNVRQVRINDNTFRFRNRFTDNDSYSYGVYNQGWDCDIVNNTFDGVTNTGILWGCYAKTDSIFGDSPDNTDLPTSYLPFPACHISGNTILGSQDNKANYAIQIKNGISGTGHIHGMRILNNYTYGFNSSVYLNNTSSIATETNPGWKDTIVSNNVFISTPDSNANDPHGIHFKNDSAQTSSYALRSLFTNNIFDDRSTDTNINLANLVDLYDNTNSKYLNASKSNFMGNILNADASTTSKALVFATSTSDTSQTTEGVNLMGNIFVNFGTTDTEDDVLTDISGNSHYFVGTPTGDTSADDATFWGLNVWSSIEDTGWTGTT